MPNSKYLNFGSTTADNVVTFENAINLNNGNRVINVVDNAASAADYAVLSGALSNGTITKNGGGTLRLSGPNTYAGGTTIADGAGTVEITSTSSLGTGTVTMNGQYTAVTISNVSGGALALANNFAYSYGGTQNFRGGDLVFQGTTTLSTRPNMGGTLSVGAGQTLTFIGPVTNAIGTQHGGFAQSGSGTIIIASDNSGNGSIYAGNTSGSGRLGIGNTGALGGTAHTITFNSGADIFAYGAAQTVGNPIAFGAYGDTITFSGTNDLTFSGNVSRNNSNSSTTLKADNTGLTTFGGLVTGTLPASGTGSDWHWIKSGTGTIRFSGSNAYNVRTQINAGALRATDGVGLPANSFLRLNGGVLESSGSFVRALGAKPANGATVASQFQWVSGGGFAAHGGTLSVDVNNDGPGASPLVWASTANFVANAQPLVFGSVTANDVVTMVDHINLNAATRTVQVDDNPATSADYAVLAGNLTGTGASALTKTGAGTLFLNGTNTYTGATTVTAGGIGGSGSLAGNLVFNAGTRFRAVVGQPLTVSNLTISASCTIDVTNAGGGTVLTYTGTRSGTFAEATGLRGRIVSYATPGQVKILSPGTILLLR